MISTKKVVKGITPYGLIWLYRKTSHGKQLRYCPICESSSVFRPYGSVHLRPNAMCSNCGSLERHRLIWLFLDRKVGIKSLTPQKTMLHVAPEQVLQNKFRRLLGKKYITADKYEPADVKMDITKIKYPAGSFDYIICNHVLEHVIDDLKAMKELRRVLKKNGWAILLVPIANMKSTYEDSNITSDEDRFREFGQHDHVRKYGHDYIERLKKAGFKVEVYKAVDIATRREVRHMSLQENDKLTDFITTDIIFCTK